MATTMYGYARVSSADQNLDRQLDALQAFGVERTRIFTDKASGRDFDRPAWRELLRSLDPDDVLVVKSIDRLGRDYEEIQEQWRRISRELRAHIVVLDMPLLDTRQDRQGITGVLIADIVLQLLSYVAQVERESIHQRQAEGIAAARVRGVHLGRPRIRRPEAYEQMRRRYGTGEITQKDAAQALGVSASTFARWMRDDMAAGRG